MSSKSLRNTIGRISRREPVPAIIVDVIGQKCTVRLSTRGSLLRNLDTGSYSFAKGDSAYVDYSRGIPFVVPASGARITEPIERTGNPVISAEVVKDGGSLEVTNKGTPWGSLYGIPVYVLEDLSSQITGTNSHFALTTACIENPIITCNLQQSPYSILMDETMDGFTLTYTPTTRDIIIAQYRIAGTV